MKKLIVKFLSFVICFVMLIVVSGCGERKEIDGIVYDTYGLCSEGEKKNDNIEYEVIFDNVVLAVVLSETIIAPVYIICCELYQPVGKKCVNGVKGQVCK